MSNTQNWHKNVSGTQLSTANMLVRKKYKYVDTHSDGTLVFSNAKGNELEVDKRGYINGTPPGQFMRNENKSNLSEELTPMQIRMLKTSWERVNAPSITQEPWKKLCALLYNRTSPEQLKMLSNAGIKWVSKLAKERIEMGKDAFGKKWKVNESRVNEVNVEPGEWVAYFVPNGSRLKKHFLRLHKTHRAANMWLNAALKKPNMTANNVGIISKKEWDKIPSQLKNENKTTVNEAKFKTGDLVRVVDKPKYVADKEFYGKSGYVKQVHGRDILVTFPTGRTIVVAPQDLVMNPVDNNK